MSLYKHRTIVVVKTSDHDQANQYALAVDPETGLSPTGALPLTYNRALSATERKAVERYLGARYGVAIA